MNKYNYNYVRSILLALSYYWGYHIFGARVSSSTACWFGIFWRYYYAIYGALVSALGPSLFKTSMTWQLFLLALQKFLIFCLFKYFVRSSTKDLTLRKIWIRPFKTGLVCTNLLMQNKNCYYSKTFQTIEKLYFKR